MCHRGIEACLQVAVVELPVRLVHAIQKVQEDAEVGPLVERSEGQRPGRLFRLEVLKHGGSGTAHGNGFEMLYGMIHRMKQGTVHGMVCFTVRYTVRRYMVWR